MRPWLILGPVLGAAVLAPSVLGDDRKPTPADPDWRPPRRLSAYGLFDAQGAPRPGVVRYELNTPLFSDYARKRRFVRLPPGRPARYTRSGPLAFPVGTVLVKTFLYPVDARDPAKGEQVLETRLLIHRPDGWIGLPYVWKGKDAFLKVAGARLPTQWIDAQGATRKLRYLVPNMNQCKSCHQRGGKLQPIGPTAVNLNRLVRAGGKPTAQLARWTARKLLTGAPPLKQVGRLPVWDDPRTGSVAARARAYLHVNCAHCHDPQGAGDTSGLDLRVGVSDPTKLGVLKPPVAAGRGSGGRPYGIVPGKPERSILLHRMESTDIGVMMPEVGRRTVHAEGVALIKRWIAELQPPAR